MPGLIPCFCLLYANKICTTGGDGLCICLLVLPVQVVNGLMEREDWEQAIKTPIGMLPMGSGNGLCASTLYESG